MLSRISYSVGRVGARSMHTFSRSLSTTVRDAATADDALKFSGYTDIDFTIKESATVFEAVQKFAAYNIGCLVMTDEAGTCDSSKTSSLLALIFFFDVVVIRRAAIIMISMPIYIHLPMDSEHSYHIGRWM